MIQLFSTRLGNFLWIENYLLDATEGLFILGRIRKYIHAYWRIVSANFIDMSTIEIKREHGQLDTITFSFRYILLTEAQKIEIENKLKGTKTVSKLSKKNGYVLMFDLSESIDPKIIKELNERLQIGETKFGIWVSLTTYYDHSGLTFPDYVLSFIKVVGGQISMSTVMISEDE